MSRSLCCLLTTVFMVPFATLVTAAELPAKPMTPVVRMLVPGFTVRELPVRLTSLNNIEYAHDGRLFAGGYDGRFHLLRDTDGDGLEDKVDTFSAEKSANYPLGIAVREGSPYFVLTDEIIRFEDTNGDGIPEKRISVVKNFDDPKLANLPYLHRRRVDSSMGIALGRDGSIYATMGNAGFSNPYWHDGISVDSRNPVQSLGEPQYATTKRRGCLLHITPDGKVEQLASGLRYVMSLQFNKAGDLFATDQEGATWCPNGNPFDELLHLQTGRHYGFPPSHPRWLPQVIDEPSVWDYAPQHQSTCGFRFNGPAEGRKRFGPEFWAGDAIVTGESRGKLWRTTLAKTMAGYVAMNQLFASISLLVVDCAISPQGDLLICCHTGAPDWGNGPDGEGKLFKMSRDPAEVPNPVFAYPLSPTETVVTFDRPVKPDDWNDLARQTWVEGGHSVAAADRLEQLRPGYAVVQMQQRQIRKTIPVRSARVSDDLESLLIVTDPRTEAVNYALALPHHVDVAHDLSGLASEWTGRNGAHWRGWLPHPDFGAARDFTRGSHTHETLWKLLQSHGELKLRTQLDVWNILVPATQPGSKLDYSPVQDSVTVRFQSDAPLDLAATRGIVQKISDRESHVMIDKPARNLWSEISLTMTTPASSLNVSFSTSRDPRPRAIPTRRMLLPFSSPAPPFATSRQIPEIASGNYEAGHALFKGKAACVSCHQLRGEGVRVGADLGNLVHRDYESVLRDIVDPNATINPDAVGYTAVLKSGKVVSGVRGGETSDELYLTSSGGTTTLLKKLDIEEIVPMRQSLMPDNIIKSLSSDEIRDLMTYLLTERPTPGNTLEKR